MKTRCALAWRGICSEGTELPVPITYVETSADREMSVGDVQFVAFPTVHYDQPSGTGLPAPGTPGRVRPSTRPLTEPTSPSSSLRIPIREQTAATSTPQTSPASPGRSRPAERKS
ncbi:MAG: hypothetical protein PHU43_05330 [Candidatus Bipolaricaulis sp.]|nr:hypothetical protein [Candidatus Bipolaricaulis sp.]